MMDTQISAAAQNVAAALAQRQRASAELHDVEAGRARVAERIAALDSQRAEILARRRSGRGDADDAGRIALLDADRTDLLVLLAEADREVAEAAKPANDAEAAVAAAQSNLRHVEAQLSETALVEHANRLDALMRETLQQIAALHAPLGRGKPVWCPSVPLWQELRRLAAAAGRL